MIDPGAPAHAATSLQVIGGWLLFADMILCAILFAFWEEAARVRLTSGRRR